MKIKFPLNTILGITTEVSYALFIMLIALVICFVLSLTKL